MGKIARQPVTLVYGATDTVKTFKVQQNGYLRDFSLDIANFATAATLVVTINDKNGKLWYTSAAINKNQEIVTHPTNAVPVDYDDVVTITLNAAAGVGGGNIEAVLAIEVK